MAETKGITIDLYGNATDFEKTLDDVNKGLKGTKDELKSINKELKINPKGLDSLNDKLKNISNTQTLLREKIKLLQDEMGKMGKEEIGSEKWNGLKEEIEKAQNSLAYFTKEFDKVSAKKDSIQQTGDAVGSIRKNADDSTNSVIKLGDIIKANLISEAIKTGIKSLANEIKSVAKELDKWADGYREAQVYEIQFENNIRNTADATDEEIEALKQLAKQKSKQGVVSKKAITSAYQELATYVESTDAIETLTDALVDMSAQQYGVDASADSVRNLATTLGKALANGDFSGLTRLGYGFNEAQKYIMKYGTELQRAKVIADIVGESIGGMNERLLETDAGQLFQVNQYFDEIKTSIGEVFSEFQLDFIQGIMPELQTLIDGVLQWIIDHKDEMKEMVKSIVDWLTSDDTKQFFKDVGQIIIDIGEIITKVVELADKMGLLKFVWEEFKGVVDAVKTILDNIVADLEYISSHGLGEWLNSGTDYSYMYGEPDSWTPGWSGGYGALNSGGHTINMSPVFNVYANNVTRADVRAWSQWMLDDINDGLGRAI